jgi:hypothetical protein
MDELNQEIRSSSFDVVWPDGLFQLLKAELDAQAGWRDIDRFKPNWDD